MKLTQFKFLFWSLFTGILVSCIGLNESVPFQSDVKSTSPKTKHQPTSKPPIITSDWNFEDEEDEDHPILEEKMCSTEALGIKCVGQLHLDFKLKTKSPIYYLIKKSPHDSIEQLAVTFTVYSNGVNISSTYGGEIHNQRVNISMNNYLISNQFKNDHTHLQCLLSKFYFWRIYAQNDLLYIYNSSIKTAGHFRNFHILDMKIPKTFEGIFIFQYESNHVSKYKSLRFQDSMKWKLSVIGHINSAKNEKDNLSLTILVYRDILGQILREISVHNVKAEIKDSKIYIKTTAQLEFTLKTPPTSSKSSKSSLAKAKISEFRIFHNKKEVHAENSTEHSINLTVADKSVKELVGQWEFQCKRQPALQHMSSSVMIKILHDEEMQNILDQKICTNSADSRQDFHTFNENDLNQKIFEISSKLSTCYKSIHKDLFVLDESAQSRESAPKYPKEIESLMALVSKLYNKYLISKNHSFFAIMVIARNQSVTNHEQFNVAQYVHFVDSGSMMNVSNLENNSWRYIFGVIDVLLIILFCILYIFWKKNLKFPNQFRTRNSNARLL